MQKQEKMVTAELLEQFHELWNWGRLSWNLNLPYTAELLEKYKDKWDWIWLSKNETIQKNAELLKIVKQHLSAY